MTFTVSFSNKSRYKTLRTEARIVVGRKATAVGRVVLTRVDPLVSKSTRRFWNW